MRGSCPPGTGAASRPKTGTRWASPGGAETKGALERESRVQERPSWVLVDRLYLQTHVIRQQREEVVLHVAVDERVPEHPVQQEIPGQVQNPVAHLVDPLRSAGRGEHVQADVLTHTHTNFSDNLVLLLQLSA